MGLVLTPALPVSVGLRETVRDFETCVVFLLISDNKPRLIKSPRETPLQPHKVRFVGLLQQGDGTPGQLWVYHQRSDEATEGLGEGQNVGTHFDERVFDTVRTEHGRM